MATIKIQFDNLKKDNWSEKEVDNVKLMISFVQKLMNDHDFEGVIDRFNNSDYRQHNRSIPDGIEGLVQYVASFVKKFPEYVYDVKHVYADDDFVIFHSQITTKKKDRGNDRRGINVIDTWRIKDGQIVEHWDSLQPMNGFLRFYFWLTGGKIANSNGVY